MDKLNFFNLEKKLEEHGLLDLYLDPNKSALFLINGARNIGKSTNTYESIIKNGGFTPNKKVALLRNRKEQSRIMKNDFSNRFKNQFIAVGENLYNMEKVVIVDKESNEEIVTYKKNELVGHISSISTFANLKSIEAKNIAYIFYEEYNEEMIGLGVYEKFINLITTLIRFSNVKIILMGNRDSYTNDFLVNFEILPQENYDYDRLYEVKKDMIYVLELGGKQYEGLKNNETLFYALAQYSNKSKQYLDGKYQNDFSRRVINYKRIINGENFKPIFELAVGGLVYTFCKYEKSYAILSPQNYLASGLVIYALDITSASLHESKVISKSDIQEIIDIIFSNHKRLNIWYDSFDTLEIFKNLILKIQLEK